MPDEIDVDWMFLAVLVGVIANGAHEDWQQVYQEAKIGAAAITEYVIEDAITAELDEVKKDFHG